VDALNARASPSKTGTARALTVTAVVAIVGAGVLALAGARAGGGDAGDGLVLNVDDAVASTTPSTVPPVVTTRPPEPERRAPEVTEPVATTSAVQGAAPVDAAPEEVERRPEPVGLQIETVDVSRYPVRSVGLQDNGQLEIPDETEIGWYKYGATAGHPGATVLAAHVNWRGSKGPFARLGTVEPGDQVEVALDDGSTRNYVVTERTMYGKLDLPRSRIWRNTGDEELVLITCGGDFNPELRSFKSNIVVYAVPIG